MTRMRLLWPVALVLLAGCFPLELDVNSKGEVLVYREEGFLIYDPASGKATPVAGAGKGTPAFARFAPDGKHILTVVKEYGYRFNLVPLAGGTPRTLFEASDTAYALFSPSGNQLAVTRFADEKKFKDAPQTVPELHLIEVAGGGKQLVASEVAACVRWFADSRRLLICKVSHVDKEGRYTAQLEEFDPAARTSRPLASVIGDARMILDLSADNQRVLVTALAIGSPGAKLIHEDGNNARHLFELQLKNLAVAKLMEDADFARYSPSGKKILLHAADGLMVADLAENYFTTVVEQRDHLPSSGTALPGWINEDTIYFFQERETYVGTVKSLSMVIAKSDGTSRQTVQPALDRAALVAESRFPKEAPDGPKAPTSEDLKKLGELAKKFGGGDPVPAPAGWDERMTYTAGGCGVFLLGCGLVVLLQNRRRAPVNPAARAAHPSQTMARGFTLVLAFIGCGTTGYLAHAWYEEVNAPKVQEAREMLPVVRLFGGPEEAAKVQEQLTKVELHAKTLYFLFGAIAAGALGGLLGMLRLLPGFACALLLTAVAAPAILLPATALFTCPFLLSAAVASRLKPMPITQ